jgi:hypothetical protein
MNDIDFTTERLRWAELANAYLASTSHSKKLLKNWSGQPFQQEADHTELDHGFTIGGQPFGSAAMATIIEQPRNSPLHCPTPRHHLKPLALGTGDL